MLFSINSEPYLIIQKVFVYRVIHGFTVNLPYSDYDLVPYDQHRVTSNTAGFNT